MSREAIFKSTAEWLQRAYHRQRADWAEETGRPFPKRRKKARPPPATMDAEPENG